MWVIVVLIVILISYGFWEFRAHQNKLKGLRVRIHVNGTRGKSSVTRLIAGGLRGGGLRVFAKTTGTKPRMIFVDGSEIPVLRIGKANIIEQTRIVARAMRQNADYFVTECMGVQPHLQDLLENKFIKSHVGVITNVRGDHLDEMGPTLPCVAASLCNSIPKDGHVFTAEDNFLDIIEARAAMRNTKVHKSDPCNVANSDMRGFTYLEHKDNVALALEVCQHFGVSKADALRGMQQANPDPGVLRRYQIEIQGKSIEFVNAFAANDPDSYKIIWQMLLIHREPDKKLIVVLNSRKDRIQRSEQMGEFIATELDADFYVITGQLTHAIVNKAVACGLPHDKILNLGGKSLETIFDDIVKLTEKKSLVFGIGNIVGFGEEIVNYFVEKGSEIG
jgi:gamma-polyglutamate synthase